MLGDQTFDETKGLIAFGDGTLFNQFRRHPQGGVNQREGLPASIGARPSDQAARRLGAYPQLRRPAAECVDEAVRLGPGAPVCYRDSYAMLMQGLEENRLPYPSPSALRVHHLYQSTEGPPGDDEMQCAAWCRGQHDRRQRQCFAQQQMFARHDHLAGVATQHIGDLLERVDRCAVELGLAGFTQSPVLGRDARAAQHRGQGRRAAVHGGGLDDLGCEEPPPM